MQLNNSLIANTPTHIEHIPLRVNSRAEQHGETHIKQSHDQQLTPNREDELTM